MADDIPFDFTNAAYCAACRAISFQSLPHEEDPGVAHQPSLLALRLSSYNCLLCHFLLSAVNKTRRTLSGRDRSPGAPGNWNVMTSIGTEAEPEFIKSVMGAYAPGGMALAVQSETSEEPFITEFEDENILKPWLYGNWYVSDENEKLLIGMGVRLGKSAELAAAEGNTKRDMTLRGSQLRLRTEDNSTLANLIPGRYPAMYGHSDIASARIRNWTKRCSDNHICTPKITTLPTRVLDLGEDASQVVIHLIHTGNMIGQYTALSHCWGKSQVLTTTRSTLIDRMQGISENDLPETYFQAVLISRNLGIRYLWIDSLCIIQDSATDWEYEAARMANVYSNSFLTISASSSTGSQSGCFATLTTRNTPFTTHENRSLGYHKGTSSYLLKSGGDIITRENIAGLVSKGSRTIIQVNIAEGWMPCSRKKEPLIYRIGSFGNLFDPITAEHLSTRGWTLQERLLSPRVLHCGSPQLYWECNWSFLGEDGNRYDWGDCNLEALVGRELLPNTECGIPLKNSISLSEGSPAENTKTHGRWRGGWLHHMQDYSQRQLTVDQDKLPALAGLARIVASKTGDNYYAGLWERHIHEDLCWRVNARDENRVSVSGGYRYTDEPINCVMTRPKEYRAPTWSWASLDGWIKFKPLDFAHIVAEFIACEVTPSGADKFAKVSGGWIKLWGPLFKISGAPGYVRTPDEPLGFGELAQFEHPTGRSMGTACFDFEPIFPCYGLFLDAANCLLLQPQGKLKNTYTRIGIGTFMRTMKQRAKDPPNRFALTVFGPATTDDSREFVTIF